MQINVIYLLFNDLCKLCDKSFNDFDFIQNFHLFHSVPWNENQFFGWFFNNFSILLASIPHFIIDGTFLAFFVTICEYHRAYHGFFCSMIQKCDELDRQNQKCLKLQLQNAIQFYISAKRYEQNTIKFVINICKEKYF